MMDITYRHHAQMRLILRLTPSGPVVLMPAHLEADSVVVQQFVADALAQLPERETVTESMTVEQVQTLVRHWQERLGVTVSRVQVRKMRNKWGSISTAGTLTLADDILHLPQDLAEYVVVHELLHLKFPDHRQVWQVSMGMYLPDWREREQRLQGYIGPAIG